jgi:23S rRNA (cytidine1920-2'-O)/16S rRNA (cytidine1409-2'-O)-methyltransferase
LTQHADPVETDLLVAPDRPVVVRGRVDHEAVVAEVVDEVPGHSPDGVGTQPAALVGRTEEEVDARVPELLVRLLVVLDHSGNPAVDDDCEDDDAVVVAARLLAHVLRGETAPPPLDLRIGAELHDCWHVCFGKGPQHHAISLQLHDVLVTPTVTTLAAMRKRLDVVLVERGLAESRAQAQALVLAGLVPGYDKPGHQVAEDVDLHVERPPRFVSRGGEKLANALEQLELELDGRDAVDVGASTGGFTDYLLQHGVARVIAVDVGYGQLHPKLRGDPRVTVMERTNARELTELPFRPDLLVADVSFISVRIALPPVLRLLQSGWDAVVLVKPQFEAGKDEVGRGGVVRDAAIHRRVLREVVDAALDWGGTAVGVVDSGLPGPKGNHEFFVHLINRPDPVLLDDIDQRIDRAVAPV